MKKKFLALCMVLCLSLSMVPAAFAAETTMSEEDFRAAVETGSVTMTGDVTLTSPVRIENGVTITGNGFSVSGSGSDGLLCIDTNDAVTIDNLTINGTVGIEVVSESPNISLTDSEINVSSRGIRFFDENSNDNVPAIFSDFTLNLDNTTIQNTLKPADKTYENWSHQGDSRGISIWNMENSTITIQNNSKILGFGYPINMAGDNYTNGVRDAKDSTINIINSDVWGWCAMNIWTIDTTFNITNSNLKGFVETDNPWNSFATIVLNEDIYGNITDDEKANVFNISGGSVTSDCVSNDGEVFHCLFRLDEEFMSEFHFYEDEDTMEKVDLYCKMPFSAFVLTYDEMTMEDFTTWAQTKLSCSSEDTTYNWGAIAPEVNVDAANALMLQNVVPTEANGVDNEGGQMQ